MVAGLVDHAGVFAAMKKYTVRPIRASLADNAPMVYQVVMPSGQIDEVYDDHEKAKQHAKRENEKQSTHKRHFVKL
jgi:hypothetical protein